ncbi:MAG: hypothetical protein REH83_06920, partial [Rickettsiella sp.]|nr:hypothetical protein [Rickettsiella sp.]
NQESALLSEKTPPTPTTPLDANESAFNLTNLGSTLYAKSPLDQPQIAFLNKRVRRLSNSDRCLSEGIPNLSSGSIIELENNNEIHQNLGRRRSNTLPPNIAYDSQKKELVDRKIFDELKKYNVSLRKRTLFNCGPNTTSTSRNSAPPVNLVMSH